MPWLVQDCFFGSFPRLRRRLGDLRRRRFPMSESNPSAGLRWMYAGVLQRRPGREHTVLHCQQDRFQAFLALAKNGHFSKLNIRARG